MTPPTSLGYTGTPANANLDTLPQIPAVLGALPASVVAALAAFNVVPVVASAAARDALITAPVVNQRVLRTDTGYYERYGAPASGANTWLPEGVTRAAGPIVTSNFKGAIGNGVADDAPFLAAADVAAVASGGRHELDLSALPTKCFINSNLTLTGHFRPNPGGGKLIYVGAGKVLTIAGAFDPAIGAVFDHTMPGAVVYTSTAISHFYAKWHNVKGDGVTDDSAAIMKMYASLPDGAKVLYTAGMKCILRNTVRQSSRNSIYEFSEVPSQAGNVGGLGAVEFMWEGAWGGRMFLFDRCQNPRQTGFVYRLQQGGAFGFAASINAASKTLTDTAFEAWVGGFNAGFHQNRKIIVFGAGPLDSDGNATDLITTVDAVTDTHTIQLHDAASTTVTVARWIIGSVAGLPAMSAIDVTGQAGVSGDQQTFGGKMTVGHDVLVIDPALWDYAVFYPDQVGSQITVKNYDGAGHDFVTTIAQYYTSRKIRLTATAPATFVGKQAIVAGPGGTDSHGSRAIFTNGLITTSVAIPGSTQLRISVTADVNHELCDIDDFSFSGAATADNPTTATTSLATPKRIFGPGFAQRQQGQQITVEGAGPAGGQFLSKILAVAPDVSYVDVADNVSVAVVGQLCVVGTGEGDQIVIGSSANSHGHQIQRTSHIAFRRAIDNGGGFSPRLCTFTSGEAPYYYRGTARACVHINDLMEACGCHIAMQSNAALNGPIILIGGNTGIQFTRPNTPAINLDTGGLIICQGIGYDGPSTVLRPFFGCANFNGTLISEGTRHYPGTTMAMAGYATALSRTAVKLHVRADLNITDLTSGYLTNVQHLAQTVDSLVGGLRAENMANGGASPNTYPAIIGKSRAGPFSGGGDVLVGVQGTCDISGTGTVGGKTLIAVRAQMPVYAGAGHTATVFEGLHVTPPAVTGGGASPASGVVIESLAGGGIGATKGIDQQSTGDANTLNGVTSFGSGRVEKATVYIDIGAAGNATPNPAGALHYRYRIAGAATINAPINPQDGMEFEMEIFNNTGGAITPTLNAIFLGTGYGAIGAGKSRTRRWVSDANLTKWKPVGAVSEDF